MLRLSIIIRALDVATNALKNIPDCYNEEITQTFMTEAKAIADNIPSTAFIVDEPTIN